MVNLEKRGSDLVLVILESHELKKITDVVSTGLNCEQSRKTAESRLKVTCKGDPCAETGDKVPIIINTEQNTPGARDLG